MPTYGYCRTEIDKSHIEFPNKTSRKTLLQEVEIKDDSLELWNDTVEGWDRAGDDTPSYHGIVLSSWQIAKQGVRRWFGRIFGWLETY